jgi:TPP-dependent pyruvate/acetoin dehydrogenase alpha subunit
MARGNFALRMGERSFEERVIEALSDAVGDRMRKTGRITAIFFTGTESSRIMQEARALAIAAKLPVLMVEHLSPKQRNASNNKRQKPTAFEYPSIPVDTQDVIAMYRVAYESIVRAREGGGPTHIVGVPWKPVAANTRKSAAKARGEGAVAHLEEWLTVRGLPVQQWRREIVAGFETKKEGRRNNAQNAPPGAMEDEEQTARAIA